MQSRNKRQKTHMPALLNGFVLLLALSCQSCRSKQADEIKSLYLIGTDQVSSFSYITAGSLSQIYNASDGEYGFKTAVVSKDGSREIIQGLLEGEIDFGIVRSDIHSHAVAGIEEWTEPQPRLRALFSMESECINLIVSADSGIDEINDIRGKRINLAPPESGQLKNTIDILEAFDISPDDIKGKRDSLEEARIQLEDGRIDGYFDILPHPNEIIRELSSGRVPIKLIETFSPSASSGFREKSFYAPSLILKKWYPLTKSRGNIQAIGLKSTVLTTEEIPEEVVYALTKEIFENLETLKRQDPAFEILSRESMLQGLSAPIHPGALKYYQEAGLVEKINPILIP